MFRDEEPRGMSFSSQDAIQPRAVSHHCGIGCLMTSFQTQFVLVDSAPAHVNQDGARIGVPVRHFSIDDLRFEI
jgi:hypothetical protein